MLKLNSLNVHRATLAGFSLVLIIVIRHVKVCSMQHTASQEAVLSNSNMASQISKRPTRKVI